MVLNITRELYNDINIHEKYGLAWLLYKLQKMDNYVDIIDGLQNELENDLEFNLEIDVQDLKYIMSPFLSKCRLKTNKVLNDFGRYTYRYEKYEPSNPINTTPTECSPGFTMLENNKKTISNFYNTFYLFLDKLNNNIDLNLDHTDITKELSSLTTLITNPHKRGYSEINGLHLILLFCYTLCEEKFYWKNEDLENVTMIPNTSLYNLMDYIDNINTYNTYFNNEVSDGVSVFDSKKQIDLNKKLDNATARPQIFYSNFYDNRFYRYNRLKTHISLYQSLNRVLGTTSWFEKIMLNKDIYIIELERISKIRYSEDFLSLLNILSNAKKHFIVKSDLSDPRMDSVINQFERLILSTTKTNLDGFISNLNVISYDENIMTKILKLINMESNTINTVKELSKQLNNKIYFHCKEKYPQDTNTKLIKKREELIVKIKQSKTSLDVINTSLEFIESKMKNNYPLSLNVEDLLKIETNQLKTLLIVFLRSRNFEE